MTGRIDVLTIFPGYLAPLELSLVGKARAAGLLTVDVHDLRTWASDRHRTVDDTPFGGGAGMVMRPDVWGLALDEVLSTGADVSQTVLIPTPAGEPFTQALAEELALLVCAGGQLALACGRYEGIDARVGEHYARAGEVNVREVSIGDYVLNGGEVAALVIIEAVARLMPGVIGNPDSLVEESHGSAGLLEYPVYTKPPSWRGQDVPEVLLSGDHGRIGRWRRRRAVDRTAQRRPDLIEALGPAQVRPARALDAEALAEVAARTFPLACPPSVTPTDAAAFVAENLSAEQFRRYLRDRRRHVLVAELAGAVVGYTLLVVGAPENERVRAAAPDAGAELSKCYVLEDFHGQGLAALLLTETLALAARSGLTALWLGVNRANERAQRFYGKHGFERVGERTFTVGTRTEHDYVMAHTLRSA
ncbi:tRNA (guanosine(37)-N1)-methyltransferase TrmD [Ruania zhangjianzhongii]|uniref:tRNA (guanosine(37)-N1)-methyltransferase TrmD n=1 Tax=Ruania zhangjianzhongii TaxID=2603206 RepID=UPI0011CC46AB